MLSDKPANRRRPPNPPPSNIWSCCDRWILPPVGSCASGLSLNQKTPPDTKAHVGDTPLCHRPIRAAHASTRSRWCRVHSTNAPPLDDDSPTGKTTTKGRWNIWNKTSTEEFEIRSFTTIPIWLWFLITNRRKDLKEARGSTRIQQKNRRNHLRSGW